MRYAQVGNKWFLTSGSFLRKGRFVMIPHIYDDKIQGEEQLPSPVEEKQTEAPLEEQQKQTPPRPQRWRQRILGVALPLAGGFLAGWSWLYLTALSNFSLGGFYLGVLVLWLTVLVGALLLRSWWSLLIVPVAAFVGTVLGDLMVFPLIQGGVPMMQESIGTLIGGFPDSVVPVVMMVFVPLIVAALIGTLLGNRFWRRWEMRKIRQ
jgi:hypothetical protein